MVCLYSKINNVNIYLYMQMKTTLPVQLFQSDSSRCAQLIAPGLYVNCTFPNVNQLL